MVNKDLLNELTEQLQKVSAYQDKELSHRGEWGVINFDDVHEDVQNVISISASMVKLPLRYLPDNTGRTICQVIKELMPRLDELDKFSIAHGDANSHRANLASNLHQSCDRFYQEAGTWLPFLFYQQGDVAERLKQAQKKIQDAEQSANDSLSRISDKENEIAEIVARTREASADAGVAVFTEDFQHESENAQKAAGKWLWTTVAFAALTLAVPVAAYFFEDYSGIEKSLFFTKLASKVVVISVLLTATLWCGRLYKSMRHLAIVNRHRAIGLKTFRAFSAAASDETTKNAVLMETTRSIFANGATGLIHETSADSDSNVIQIAGKVMDTATAK